MNTTISNCQRQKQVILKTRVVNKLQNKNLKKKKKEV